MIEAVHSGFQCGADQAGVITAHLLGLRTGGWIPLGWKTEAGPASWAAEYGIREHDSPMYPPRTALNVRETDGTVIFGNIKEAGSRLTKEICTYQSKPWFCVEQPNMYFGIPRRAIVPLRDWLTREKIRTLNVAGNRESVNPGIFRAVSEFLMEVLEDAQ